MSIAAGTAGPLLGRDAEVELLASLFDDIGDGGGALVLYGEPGIGKSRLLAVAAGFARERGFTMLSTTGPSWASRIHRVAAASPSRDRVGFCTMLTRNPSRVSDS